MNLAPTHDRYYPECLCAFCRAEREKVARRRLEESVLMCHTETHFYLIDAMPNVPLEQQAKDNGEANPRVIRITTPFQRVLWERPSVLDEEILDVSNR